MAAHSTLVVNFSGVPNEILGAIRSGTEIPYIKIAALYALAVELNESKGRPEPKAVNDFLNAGYNEKDLRAIILALSAKISSNYSNQLLDTNVGAAFAAYKV